ncbi:MAG: hypothetical protein MZW92_19265 [Comamonadaceae bacterium]|nr:hypothetical protein [Comamonadaceae bacterium]
MCFERMGDPWQGERADVPRPMAWPRCAATSPTSGMVAAEQPVRGTCIGRFHRMRGVDDADAQARESGGPSGTRARAQALLPAAAGPALRRLRRRQPRPRRCCTPAAAGARPQPLLRDVAGAQPRLGGFRRPDLAHRLLRSPRRRPGAGPPAARRWREVDAIREAAIAASDQRATLIRLHHDASTAPRARSATPARALACAGGATSALERERATRASCAPSPNCS